MFKSSSQLLSVILGVGLIGSNFFSLMILARKDSSIPNLTNLPYTDTSSFSIRSEKTKDGHSWSLNQNQHSPKTMLFTKDIKEELKGLKGRKKRESYIHQESIAHPYQSFVNEEIKDEELTAKQIKCIEKKAIGKSNGEIVGSGIGAVTSPALMQVPIIGPIASGIWFGLARKEAGKAGAEISENWNNC
mgnify:CR=1 FL=1